MVACLLASCGFDAGVADARWRVAGCCGYWLDVKSPACMAGGALSWRRQAQVRSLMAILLPLLMTEAMPLSRAAALTYIGLLPVIWWLAASLTVVAIGIAAIGLHRSDAVSARARVLYNSLVSMVSALPAFGTKRDCPSPLLRSSNQPAVSITFHALVLALAAGQASRVAVPRRLATDGSLSHRSST